jgi:streptogramin lyase
VGDGGDYLIRKVTPNGEVSTVAKIDTTAYTIGGPEVWGLTLDLLGTFYYTRTLGSVLYKVSPDGKPIVVAGSQLGDEDGPGGQAKFSNLIGLVSDIQGNIYGADYENYKIRKITPSGIVSTVPGTGVYTAPGISSTNFLSLQSIALDKNGNFYVTDPNQSAVIKLSSSGEAKHLASMRYPAGIVVDAVGNVYVSDMSDHIINKISTDGTITLIAGTGKRGYKDGMGAEAAFNTPQALVLDPTGKILYVADAANGAIRKIVLP